MLAHGASSGRYFTPTDGAAVYPDLWILFKLLGFASLTPQAWGKLNLQSPPGLGD